MKKILTVIPIILLSFASQAKATDDFIYDLEPPAGNIGAICANNKKVSVTGSGACLNYWGRKFWVMPNGKKIASLDYKNPFFDEPYYSNWRVCNLQSDVNKWSNCHDNLELKFPDKYLEDEPEINTTVSSPNWQQSGCDNLWGLNQEALEWDILAAMQANHEVSMQNNYPSVSTLGCPNRLAWEWKIVKVKQFVWQYTLCSDGWRSSSTGRGTCSWHGGIHSYRGYYKTVESKRPQFYWVN